MNCFMSSKHEPITVNNAKSYLEIDLAWQAAIRREASRGARIPTWLIGSVCARIALAEAILAANAGKDLPPDLLTNRKAAA